MIKNTICGTILLTVVWIILREDLSVLTVTTGAFISCGCILLCRRFLPAPETPGVNYFRLAVYMLYLLAQVYIAGIATIRIILSGARAEIIEVQTKITDGFLRTLLVNSITLVPGSVSLDITDDRITALWLVHKNKNPRGKSPEDFIKNNLERMLIKAQK